MHDLENGPTRLWGARAESFSNAVQGLGNELAASLTFIHGVPFRSIPSNVEMTNQTSPEPLNIPFRSGVTLESRRSILGSALGDWKFFAAIVIESDRETCGFARGKQLFPIEARIFADRRQDNVVGIAASATDQSGVVDPFYPDLIVDRISTAVGEGQLKVARNYRPFFSRAFAASRALVQCLPRI